MARGKLSVPQVAADLFLLILALIGSTLYFKLAKPFKRGFYCDDETIQYPYKEDTVSNAMLYIIGVVIPFILIVTVEVIVFKFFRTYSPDNSFCSELIVRVYKVSMAFLYGAAVTHFITDMTKYSVGRLRPHFMAVCEPDVSKFNCSDGYITTDVCSGENKHRIDEARISFPSGHASQTLYGMVFLMIYIRCRLTWSSLLLLKPFLLSGCLLVGVYVSVSRIFDYKHHPGDVAVGALLGTAVALVFGYQVADLVPQKICQCLGLGPTSHTTQCHLSNNSCDANVSIIT